MSAVLVTPVQERSVEMVKRIESIALEHLREVGVRSFSTATVAKRAYISVGIIYRYWPSTEALIEAIAPGACRAWEALDASYRAIDKARSDLESADAGDEGSVQSAIAALASVEIPEHVMDAILGEDS